MGGAWDEDLQWTPDEAVGSEPNEPEALAKLIHPVHQAALLYSDRWHSIPRASDPVKVVSAFVVFPLMDGKIPLWRRSWSSHALEGYLLVSCVGGCHTPSSSVGPALSPNVTPVISLERSIPEPPGTEMEQTESSEISEATPDARFAYFQHEPFDETEAKRLIMAFMIELSGEVENRSMLHVSGCTHHTYNVRLYDEKGFHFDTTSYVDRTTWHCGTYYGDRSFWGGSVSIRMKVGEEGVSFEDVQRGEALSKCFRAEHGCRIIKGSEAARRTGWVTRWGGKGEGDVYVWLRLDVDAAELYWEVERAEAEGRAYASKRVEAH